MEQERSANILIGGEEYTLLLTTKATKEIAGRRNRVADHPPGKPVYPCV